MPAASLLQLMDVRQVCCEFLQSQLHPTNCLGIRAFADLHTCTQLLNQAHAYAGKIFFFFPYSHHKSHIICHFVSWLVYEVFKIWYESRDYIRCLGQQRDYFGGKTNMFSFELCLLGQCLMCAVDVCVSQSSISLMWCRARSFWAFLCSRCAASSPVTNSPCQQRKRSGVTIKIAIFIYLF